MEIMVPTLFSFSAEMGIFNIWLLLGRLSTVVDRSSSLSTVSRPIKSNKMNSILRPNITTYNPLLHSKNPDQPAPSQAIKRDLFKGEYEYDKE